MKPRLILGSVIGLASLLLLFSSCTKDMEDLNAKTNQEPALLNGGCSPATGDYISLISHRQGTMPFFWRGGRNDYPQTVPAANKQTFSGSDFTNQQFFVITATGGVPMHMSQSGAIGVNDGYISVGEQLTLTLSDCLMPDLVMKGFSFTFNGGNTSKGEIQMWCDGTLRDVLFYEGHDNPKTPGKGSINFAVEMIAKDGPFCFSQIIIKPTEGRIQWIGYQRNADRANWYEGTRFHLVPRPVTPG